MVSKCSGGLVDSTINKRKETNINAGELSSKIFLPPPERGPSAPVPSIMYKKLGWS